MPPRETKPDIVRIVEGLEGRVDVRMELVIRFDYGSIVPWVRRLDDETLVGIGGPDGPGSLLAGRGGPPRGPRR